MKYFALVKYIATKGFTFISENYTFSVSYNFSTSATRLTCRRSKHEKDLNLPRGVIRNNARQIFLDGLTMSLMNYKTIQTNAYFHKV